MKDHLGRTMSAEDVCRSLAAILGWGNTPPWPVLERDLVMRMKRLKELEEKEARTPANASGIVDAVCQGIRDGSLQGK